MHQSYFKSIKCHIFKKTNKVKEKEYSFKKLEVIEGVCVQFYSFCKQINTLIFESFILRGSFLVKRGNVSELIAFMFLFSFLDLSPCYCLVIIL